MIACSVLALLELRAVVAEAVAFDHEVQLLEEEIHPVAAQLALGPRLREPRAVRERQEQPLQLRVG